MFGCATAGRDFSLGGVSQLTIGSTSEKDVITGFGEPLKRQDRSENNNQYQLLTYSYAKGTANSGKGRHLTTEFKNGTLNAYLYHSALEGDNTDFNIDIVSKVKDKNLKVGDIVSLMGHPTGEVRFPSVLLKNELGTMSEIVPPPDAVSAILYMYFEVKREEKILQRYVKLFIVYTGANGSVIETRFFNGAL